MKSKVVQIGNFEGSEEIDAEVRANGFFRLVNKMGNRYWAVIGCDKPEAVVVMAASGAQEGLNTAYEAARLALDDAIARKELLDKPEEWVK